MFSPAVFFAWQPLPTMACGKFDLPAPLPAPFPLLLPLPLPLPFPRPRPAPLTAASKLWSLALSRAFASAAFFLRLALLDSPVVGVVAARFVPAEPGWRE